MTVHSPIALMDGNLALALYGSGFPVPDPAVAFGGQQQQPSEAAAAAAAALVPGRCVRMLRMPV